MKNQIILADALLFCTAIIWGQAFSFQKAAMTYMAPFTFSALRFTLGGGVVFLILLVYKNKETDWKSPVVLKQSLFLGTVLFIGNSLQQVGMIFTSVANSGFITTLYVILVPILLFLVRHKIQSYVWIAAFISLLGVVLLGWSGTEESWLGDVMQFIGAFLWATHIIFIGRFSKTSPVLALAFWQTVFCAFFNWVVVALVPSQAVAWSGVVAAWDSIFMVGVLSTGLASAFQMLGQKTSPASHAAIILSLEAVVAAVFGWVYLHESVSLLKWMGGSLVLFASIYSQVMKMRPAKIIV